MSHTHVAPPVIPRSARIPLLVFIGVVYGAKTAWQTPGEAIQTNALAVMAVVCWFFVCFPVEFGTVIGRILRYLWGAVIVVNWLVTRVGIPLSLLYFLVRFVKWSWEG